MVSLRSQISFSSGDLTWRRTEIRKCHYCWFLKFYKFAVAERGSHGGGWRRLLPGGFLTSMSHLTFLHHQQKFTKMSLILVKMTHVFTSLVPILHLKCNSSTLRQSVGQKIKDRRDEKAQFHCQNTRFTNCNCETLWDRAANKGNQVFHAFLESRSR